MRPAPTVHGPEALPDLRLWLRQQWEPGGPYSLTAARFLDARAPAFSKSIHEQVRLRRISEWEHTMLGQAELWWVGEDMVDLLLASARGIPDDATLLDLPKFPGSAFIVFAKPWLGVDADDPSRNVQVDALMLGGTMLPPLRSGAPAEGLRALSVSSYRRVSFEDGMYAAELSMALQTGAFAHAQQRPVRPDQLEGEHTNLVMDDEGDLVDMNVGPVPPQVGHGHTAASLHGETWMPLGRSDWPAEDAIGAAPWDMDDNTRRSFVEDRKVVAAFFTLVHQEGIASRIVRKAERQAMRRTERAGVDRRLSTVQVVTLRRLHRTESEPGDDSQKRQYDHRWLVAGHWRWQPCGPGRLERRLTYVRPHVKGPEDKPLRTPTRVNAWVR